MNKIKSIKWERVNIIIVLENKLDKPICLSSSTRKISNLVIKDNKIVINVTNTPEGSMLPPDNWYLKSNNNNLLLNDNLISELDSLSRVFKYENDFYAYIVTFSTNADKELIINTDFMMKNAKYKKKFQIKQGRNYKEKLGILFKIIVIHLLNWLYQVLNILHLKKKNILFLSENSTTLGENLKIIYEAVKTKDMKTQVYAKNIYSKKYNKLNYFEELWYISKAKFVVVDNYVAILSFINLSKKTKIIQTWHAGVGFKAVGYARFGKKAGPHPYISSHRKYDYIIVDNSNLIDVYNEVFGNKKENFVSCGIPKMHNFFDHENIDKQVQALLNKFKNLKKAKIILFAPTYRGSGHNNAHYDLRMLDLSKINDFCVTNGFLFLIKMHPFVRDDYNYLTKYSNIINVSKENINALMYISDILITDYSSCAYEFSYLNRPIIYFRPDKYIYEYERPIHTSYNFFDNKYEVITNEELLNLLNKLKNVAINKKIVYSNFINKKSVDEIVNILSGENK